MEKKKCTNCDTEKVTEHFYFDIYYNRFRSHCKDCIKAKRKEYRNKNKTAIAKYQKVYSAEYRSRT